MPSWKACAYVGLRILPEEGTGKGQSRSAAGLLTLWALYPTTACARSLCRACMIGLYKLCCWLSVSAITHVHLNLYGCYIVTSTHTGWWRTIKEVEPTGEGTHNPEHNRSSGSPQSHLQPYHPTLQRLHHGLLVLLGVHVLEITTQCTHAMHTCTMNMHYSTHQDMQVYPCPF